MDDVTCVYVNTNSLEITQTGGKTHVKYKATIDVENLCKEGHETREVLAYGSTKMKALASLMHMVQIETKDIINENILEAV